MNGILPIDKPYGQTSHDVVAILRRLSGQRSIGHAGTLDPMATGLLLVCLGNATRLSSYLMDGAKWYLARIAFGTQTDTDDALGKPLSISLNRCAIADVQRALATQIGLLAQTPPTFAAIKRDGVAAYKSARAGLRVDMAPRAVAVHEIDLLRFNEVPECVQTASGIVVTAEAEVLIHCGKGTYIRAIARDMGAMLGCGAHLSGLRRLASGSFTTADAVSIETLDIEVNANGPAAIEARLFSADHAVSTMPALLVTDDTACGIGMGRTFQIPLPGPVGQARVYDARSRLLALASCGFETATTSRVHPDRVFVHAGVQG